jgi:PTS system mannose-specific IIA component
VLGVVIVGHDILARAFLDASERMIGRQKQVECITYNVGDDLESVRESVAKAVREVDSGSGVVIMADMFGGVPSNLAISVAHGQNADVISGINLAMLLRLLTVREVFSLKEAVAETKEIGVRYINTLSELMAELGT